MKKSKKRKTTVNQEHTNLLEGIVNIHAFSKKEIESIEKGDAFVRVPSRELNELRVPVYQFLM